MNSRPVAFIAFKEFDNLGIGYLAAVLSREGYKIQIIDFRIGKEEIIKIIKKQNPQIIGFSIIFQYHIYEFKELINYLRESGISVHFSAGGQFASMRFRDLFELIPSIDSIVRFEGEYTFLELVNCIYSGADWRNIKGIAFKENGDIKTTPLRQPEMDLDKFPFPERSPLEEYALGKKFATILGGRGCINNCSFCNNTEYLKQSSLPINRLRKPENVVEEIDFLYQKHNCSVYLFEDDDFPVRKPKEPDWIKRFCKEIERKGLSDKIIWKINCRPDEIDHDSFSIMKENGLYLVFLGIDDGTDSGLKQLNKHMTVSDCLKGINILKELEIDFDYGFMLFQPSSTFGSVNHNLEFLRQLCSDVTAPVTFLKLRPYFDTRIEKELRMEGRIKGKPGFWDYDFLSTSFNEYYKFIEDSFMEWINDSEGLGNIIKWSRNFFSVFSHFYKMTSEVQLLKADVRRNIVQSNYFILNAMKELSVIFESGEYYRGNPDNLIRYRKNIKEKHDYHKEQIGNSVKKLSRIAEYQSLKHSFPGLLQ